MIAIALPVRYPLVACVGVGTFWLTTWQSFTVGKLRQAAGVPYPQAYAEKAEAAANPDAMRFNCAQRAHQNTMESLPHVLFGLFFTGIRYPTIAASLGAAFLVGKVFYTFGYISGDPKNRNSLLGPLGSISTLGLLLASTFTAGQMTYEFINAY